MRQKAIVSLLYLLIPLFFLFGQTIETDRPDQTETAITVPYRNLQIETGILLVHAQNTFLETRSLLVPTTLIRYGLTPTLELRLAGQYEETHLYHQGISELASGWNDLELGAKIQLYRREGGSTEAALLSHVSLPVGSAETSRHQYGLITKISIAHALGENFGIGYNVGFGVFEHTRGSLLYSLALGINVTEKLGFYLENFGAWEQFQSMESNMDGGFTYLVKENLQLDLSLGVGLKHTMSYFSIGVSWCGFLTKL